MKKEPSKTSVIEVKNNKKKKKKEKNKKNSKDSEQRNSSFEISDCENNQRAVLNQNLDSSINESKEIMPSDDDKKESNIESNIDDSVIKKKRKRNKGKKTKVESNITAPELKIMSK